MGVNLRRSKNLGAVRINMSTRGVGISTGVKGLRVGVGPRGTRVTASVPGTGIYSTKVYSGRKACVGSSKRSDSGIAAASGEFKLPNTQPMPIQAFIFLLIVVGGVIAYVVAQKTSVETFDVRAIMYGIGAMFATMLFSIIVYVAVWQARENSIKATYLPVAQAHVAVDDEIKALQRAKNIREICAHMQAIDREMQTLIEYAKNVIKITDANLFTVREAYRQEGESAILEFIKSSYRDMEDKSAMLKTEKGKANRRSKFLSEIHEDIAGLDLPEAAQARLRQIEGE